MKYLFKYKGKYRILAHYDLETNDFPRDQLGNIDSSFDDFFIPCKSQSQIYHYGQSILVAYIPSLTRGRNIVKALNAIDSLIVTNFEECDYECEFKFHSKYIDTVAEVMGAKTSGANISPFSIKNLPKQRYSIPETDLNEYKNIINSFELNEIKTIFGDFDKSIIKYMRKKIGNKEFDINADKRLRMLKGKDYIHSIGMWDEFLSLLKSHLK